MAEKIYTITEFSEKFKLGRSTVWRWATVKKYSRYLKMYDAEVVTVAGKKFIKIRP